MNPQQELELLENLLDELLSAIQTAIQSGEDLSDEFQGMLAQELEYTTQRIDQLRSETQEIPVTQTPEPVQQAPSFTASTDAQLLWVLAGQQVKPFIKYLQQFPNPETQNLLRNPDLLEETIEYLARSMPEGQPPVIGGIQQADLNSSNIWGTAYDRRTGKMRVRFQGGAEYEYDGVPANIYKAFASGSASAKTQGQNRYGRWWVGKNPSLGAAMNQYIKAGKFPYRKIR